MPTLLEALRWIERTETGEAVRMVPKLYPILESVRVIGIALLVGPALVVDLRLLGIGRDAVPVRLVARYLLPLCHLGFGIAAVTGGAMFTGVASTAGMSAAAPWKLGLIVLAGINIVVFHTGIYRSVARWDLMVRPPMLARCSAVVSGLSWLGVIVAGRFLAY